MTTQSLKRTTAGTELVRALAQEGRRIFTIKEARELAPAVGLSLDYLPESLHHLSRTGWIIRIKKGVYALSSSVPGTAPVHEFEIAMALVHPAAISHWSALGYHGMTDQIPRRVFVLTTAHSVPRTRNKTRTADEEGYAVGDTVYQFAKTKPERFFGIEDVWVNESRIKMTDPERTLLDGLSTPRYFGDFAEVLHAFEVHLPKLKLDRMVAYALKLDNAISKRLGWILERQGIEANRLNQLREVPIKGYRVLDPSSPRFGRYNSEWMIQVNLPGEAKK